MDRSIAIILKLVDQATGPLQAAAGALNTAFKGVSSVATTTTTSISSAWKGTVGRVVAGFQEMVDKGKWASLLVGGSLLNIVKDAFNATAEMEKFGAAAKFILGSEAEARKYAASLQNLAVNTQFSVSELANLGKRLIGNTSDADLSTRAMNALTQAVSFSGGGYGELEGATRAWIQTNTKAYASSEELNRQFSNTGIPVLKALAEAVVKDANNPLRKYLSASSGATGATKKMASEMEKGKDILAQNAFKSGELNAKLTQMRDKFGENSDQYKKAQYNLNSWNDKVKSATSNINAYTIAQGKANKSTAQFTVEGVMAQLGDIGDLKIPGSVLAKAMIPAFEQAFGGANEAMVQTFSGQIQKLGENIVIMKNKFLGLDAMGTIIDENGIFGKVKNFIKGINDWLEANGDKIGEWGRKLGQTSSSILGPLTFLLGTLAGAFKGILGPALLVGGAFSLIGIGIGKVLDKVKEETGQTNEVLVPAYMDLNGVLHTANASYKDMSQFIGSTVTEQKNLGKTMGEVKVEAENQQKKVDALKTSWEGLKTAVQNFFGAFAPIEGTKKQILSLSEYLAYQGLQFTTLIDQVSIFITWIRLATEYWGQFWASAVGDDNEFIRHGERIDVLKTRLDGLVQHNKDSIEKMKAMKEGWMVADEVANNGMNASWNGMAINTQQKAAEISSAISHNFSVAASTTETQSKNMYDSMFTNMSAMPPMADTQSNQMMQSFKGGIESNKPALESTVSSMMKSVDTTLGSQKSSARDHGKGLVESFIDGLKSALRGLGGMASTIAGKMGLGDLKFEHGGIIPGPVGQAIPIIAHGGERVIPRSGAEMGGGAGGGIVINFNGGVMLDSEDRVQELADKISRMLGRQNELARYGVSY